MKGLLQGRTRILVAAVFGIVMLGLLTKSSSRCRTAGLFATAFSSNRCSWRMGAIRLKMSDIQTDGEGRRIRKRSSGDDDSNKNEWLTPDDWEAAPRSSSSSTVGGGGWDDWDPLAAPPAKQQQQQQQRRSGRSSPPSRYQERSPRRSPPSYDKDYGRSSRGGGGGGGYPQRSNTANFSRRGGGRGGSGGGEYSDAIDQKKINLRALEGAGYDHLYGLAPVRNALRAQRREFVPLESRVILDYDESQDQAADERKPEAQFRPYLFLQERKGKVGRSGDKSELADEVLELAKELSLPIAYVDKGALNTLSGNRPHQGCVLRCGKIDFEPLSRIPNEPDSPQLWLVLDQIVDPQNLGALLRSAYFFGKISVLVCAKNSAPASPTVSASSAGALEDMTVYATNNLPRTLAAAEQEGFRIVGASASSPPESDIPVYDLDELPTLLVDEDSPRRPTLLVLGSEGHGIRSLVAHSCTEFVKIPGSSDQDGVDSLNVSVTGGILMWHLVQMMTADQKK